MYVKNAFRKYLKEAVGELNLRSKVTVKRRESDPAVTIHIHRHGVRDAISVDFAPVLQAGLPFPAWVDWPRPGKYWPPPEKVQEIKDVGIHFTAKGDLEWYYSFAEAEKHLARGMDQPGENTNRKKLHRVMKKLTHDIWCPERKPVLSSYVLKNVLFWECEEFPRSRDWQHDMLWARFCSLTKRLLRALSDRHLKLYFYPAVNLLEGANEAAIDAVIHNIERFMINPSIHLL